mmetsp:Transcript_74499/g.120220  ORF Transcript_74499/g.120220 Transcript_74499/m.120220 type:complete len:204 (-) Transcript_74499:64-675(-)
MLHGLAFGNSDGPLLPHLCESICNHLANHLVSVSRNRGDRCNLLRLRDRLGHLLQLLQDVLHRCVDAALQIHRVHASDNSLGAFAENCTGQHGGCRGAIARHVAGLRGNLLDERGADVLHLVPELDGPRHCDAVLGHLWRAIGLLDEDVAPLGAERHGHRIGQAIGALEHRSAGCRAMSDVFASEATSTDGTSCRAKSRKHGG